MNRTVQKLTERVMNFKTHQAKNEPWEVLRQPDAKLVLIHYGTALVVADMDSKTWEETDYVKDFGVSVSDQNGMNTFINTLGLGGRVCRAGRTRNYGG